MMRARSSESGVAMLTALVVVLVLALIAVALVNLAVSESSAARALDRSSQAFLAADAGAQWALARLQTDDDWGDNGYPTGSWQYISPNGAQGAAFPDAGSGASTAEPMDYRVAVQHPAGRDPGTNVMVRSIGRVRGATRTIQLDLHRITGADFTTYSIQTVDITQISGGGSLQFHGSAYFENDLALRGAAQAGFFNDRYVSLADMPLYLNHLYVGRNLDLGQGNPTIGTPYYWLHVAGNLTGDTGNPNFRVTNRDRVVPPPFYPSVLAQTQRALTGPGNLLAQAGSTMEMVVCRWTGGAWTRQTAVDLVLTGSAATDTFVLPPATADPAAPCAGYPNDLTQTRTGGQYMLMWDAQSTQAPLMLRNDALPTYVPGQVRVARDVRYEGLGTIVVGNQPTAVTSAQLVPQSGCALDLNGSGTCNGVPSTGHWIRAAVSPCQTAPGVDNPVSTYARVNSFGQGPDVLVFVVNGAAYSSLNANSCNQEINLVAIVGDRNSTGQFVIQNKLQWFGILMTRGMGLGQVPDFWQMPDMIRFLPVWSRDIFDTSGNPVVIRGWRELF